MQNPQDGDAATHDGDAPGPQSQDTPYTIKPIEPPVGGVHHFSDEELPFRYRSTTFAMYEPALARAIHEGSVDINPAPLRATTYAARARDAIIAKKRFNWAASFTILELEEADLVTRHNENVVTISQRRIAPKHVAIGAFASSKQANRLANILIERSVSEAELDAIARLLAGKIISGPVVIRAPVAKLFIDNLEAKYDVAVTQHSTGETVIL